MSKRQVLVVLGIWIMVFLFISFPAVWDKIFAVVTGLAVICIAFKLPAQVRAGSQDRVSYVENRNDSAPKTETVARTPASHMNDIIKTDSRSAS